LRRIVSKKHTTTAAQANCSRTEYSSWRPYLDKNCSTNLTSKVGLQLLNLCLLKVMSDT
jgi:hypothetical protein